MDEWRVRPRLTQIMTAAVREGRVGKGGVETLEFRELAATAAVRRSLVWKISFGLGPGGSLAVGALKFAVDFA
jgi:hypothetical protein